MGGSQTAGPDELTDDHFRLLVETVKDYGIFLLDRSGIVRSWNEGAQRIKGYSAEEIIGQHFSKFYPHLDVVSGKCEAELAIAIEQGRFEDFGWRIRKDGSQFWADVVITALRDRSGNHVGFAKVTRDMTDRAYRTFVEATNAIVWTADANGRANADSPSWRSFTGQTVDEWLGLRGWEPVHPEDRPATAARWSEAKAQNSPFQAEFRMRRHDGVYVWMASRGLPILNPDGTMREWFGVTSDISARKEAEVKATEALQRERIARLEAERAQSLWTTTLRSIGDAVIATDVGGYVTFMNAIAEQVTGWALSEARGRALHDVFPIVSDATGEVIESPVQKALREGVIVGLANRAILVRRDGSAVPIADSAAPIRDDTGRLFGVVLVFRDVTQEQLEFARREYLVRAGETLAGTSDYREALSAIVELAVPHLADWCAIDILEEGMAAPVQLAVAHVDPVKVRLARELALRYPPDPNASSGVANVIRTGRSELYPLLPRELLEAGARDAEHLRIIQELRLRSAMVVPLRGRQGIFGAISFVYAECKRTYGPEDLAFAEELARRASLVIERRKLEEERVRLYDSERRARREAELANRAKDEFLATVSHELRNPLQAILGWAKLLLQRNIPEEMRKPVMTIERNARAQARLIEDILDTSRIISGKLRLELGRASSASAIADAIEATRAAAEQKGVTIISQIESETDISGDPVRLQQIVSNLLSNAVKFTPQGGHVWINAERRGPVIAITVRDDGEGIAPDLLTVVFEPFRQEDSSTTKKYGGLGLGLAIVRQLVAAHGGTVRAESKGKGHGASFIVELPVASYERAAPSPVVVAGSAQRHLSGIRVLAVDDQPDSLGLVRDALSDAGADVETALSANEALEKLIDSRPDVIVTDIGMPMMDGYGLLERVHRLSPATGGRTPAIALTAYASADDAEKCATAGFETHLAKPVDLEHLINAVARATRRARGQETTGSRPAANEVIGT